MGRALIKLRGEVGDTLLPVQVHCDDNYSTAWGNKRKSFYSVPGYPTYVFDGTTRFIGAEYSDEQQYNKIKDNYETRREKATDVTVQMWAEQSADDEHIWTVTAKIGIEQGGSAKDIRVHILQLQDNYPSGNHYINCFIAAMPQQDVHLEAGETTELSHTFTIAEKFWDEQETREKIRFATFAQTKKDKYPAEIYNAGVMNYPFNPPPWEKGDTNCDGSVDFGDIDPFVTALTSQSDYESQYPDCEYLNADMNGDGAVDFADIDPFVDRLTD